MPPEYYIGIAISAILVLLLGMFLQRWLGTRFVVLHKSSGTDQLANQLSRIADSLEKLTVQPAASPVAGKATVEKLQVPIQKATVPNTAAPDVAEPKAAEPNATEPNAADPPKADQPAEHRISLSMFGR